MRMFQVFPNALRKSIDILHSPVKGMVTLVCSKEKEKGEPPPPSERLRIPPRDTEPPGVRCGTIRKPA